MYDYTNEVAGLKKWFGIKPEGYIGNNIAVETPLNLEYPEWNPD